MSLGDPMFHAQVSVLGFPVAVRVPEVTEGT
jgi:hypothetical protein